MQKYLEIYGINGVYLGFWPALFILAFHKIGETDLELYHLLQRHDDPVSSRFREDLCRAWRGGSHFSLHKNSYAAQFTICSANSERACAGPWPGRSHSLVIVNLRSEIILRPATLKRTCAGHNEWDCINCYPTQHSNPMLSWARGDLCRVRRDEGGSKVCGGKWKEGRVASGLLAWMLGA